MSLEIVQKASEVYFDLLKHKVVEETSETFSRYYEDGVRNAVHLLARQSGTQVIETPKRLHLVARADGSVFATNLTHLKSKYADVKTRKYFYAISIILMVYLASIARNQAVKLKARREGVTYYAMERTVDSLVRKWETDLAPDERSGLATGEMVTLWNGLEVDTDIATQTRPNIRTRIGLIRTAFKLLEEEGLIYVANEAVAHVYPRQELFDRIDFAYSDDDRYQEVISFLAREEEFSKEEADVHA